MLKHENTMLQKTLQVLYSTRIARNNLRYTHLCVSPL